MSEKLTIIEGISPKGHVDFNKKIINYLNKYDLDLHVGCSIVGKYEIDNVNVFNDHFLSLGRFSHAMGFLVEMIKIIKQVKAQGGRKLVLLSYDIVALPILAIYSKLLGLEIICFEHNTVPDSNLKKILQKLSFNVNRICFLKSAAEIFCGLSQRTLLTKLPLPCFGSSRPSNNQYKYIFCPSASSDLDKIKKFAEKNNGFNFIVKSDKKIELDNVTCKPFFDNYVDMIKDAQAIYIPMGNKHRVSGPLLDAIALNKIVILPKGELFDFSSEYFPNNTLDDECVLENIVFDNTFVDVDGYNSIIQNEIIEFIESCK